MAKSFVGVVCSFGGDKDRLACLGVNDLDPIFVRFADHLWLAGWSHIKVKGMKRTLGEFQCLAKM